jgi:hypothetical protein
MKSRSMGQEKVAETIRLDHCTERLLAARFVPRRRAQFLQRTGLRRCRLSFNLLVRRLTA